LCFHFVFHVRMEHFVFSFLLLLLDVCYFTTFCCKLPPKKWFFSYYFWAYLLLFRFISPIQSYVLSNIFPICCSYRFMHPSFCFH
jgi:hypothetical protein